MKSALVAALAVLAAPATAQIETLPPASAEAAVGYDEAVGCAFLGIAYGMRDDHSKEQSRDIIGLGVRYQEHAKKLSGKDDKGVVDDMATASGPIVDEIMASKQPVTEMRTRFAKCQDRAALIP